MAPIDFYCLEMGAPSRAVMLGAKAMGIELNMKPTNIFIGEHLTPEFLKMNIQHSVPTIDDNGFILTESRAILQYLANQYAKDDSFYPKDPKRRAVVDMRLMFDQGTLYQRFFSAYFGLIRLGEPRDEEKMKKVDEALEWLQHFLKSSEFVAGNDLTIADHSVVASLTSIEAVGHDLSPFLGVQTYLEKCKKLMVGYEEANGKGAAQFKAFVEKQLSSNKSDQ